MNQNQIINYSNRWMSLIILCVAQFIVIMDTSIIGVALPAIKLELGYTQSGLQWIFNAYVIAFGGFLLLGGKLSDILGAKRVFILGFIILTVASWLAGLAWSDVTLNLARALQGLGSAFIAPSAMTLVFTMFTDPKELGKALGLWGAAAAAGGSAGVFLGGIITDWISWEWIFYINIPIGIGVIFSSTKLLISVSKKHEKIDVVSSLLATGFLTVFVYTIVNAENSGWESFHTLLLFAISAFLLMLFVRLQRISKYPLIPLSIFKTHNLTFGNVVMILLAGSWIPLWFFLNLYLQQTLGYSALKSGMALLPMTLTIMLLMIGFTNKLIQKYGVKINLVAGLLSLTLSLILFGLMPENGTFLVHVLPASLLGAIGMSLAYIPGTITAVSEAKPQDSGIASGIVNTSYQIGSALGLAIIVALVSAMSNVHNESAPIGKELYYGFTIAFKAAAVISASATFIAVVFIKSKKNKS